MSKLIYKLDDMRQEVLDAIDIIAEPVAQTMGPIGGNVIFEDRHGQLDHSNDGVTISRNIIVDDPFQNAIIRIVKSASARTNTEVGDGTSSTVLMSKNFVKVGYKLLDLGYSRRDVKEIIDDFQEQMFKILDTAKIKTTSRDDIFNVAKISANNDSKIAKDVLETIDVVGEEGIVSIVQSFTDKTILVKDTGYVVIGKNYEELLPETGSIKYEGIPVIVTDKRLYYKQEAETILKTVYSSGYNTVVVVAADFIGEALPYFIANHSDSLKVVLIKEKDVEKLGDIATYLGGNVISDKKGKIVDKITIGDFIMAKSVYVDSNKSIISRFDSDKNTKLDAKIKLFKDKLKEISDTESSEYNNFKQRLANITRGMVTIKVGGRTPIETNERIYRYEDSVNAALKAMTHGHVVGGGLATINASNKLKFKDKAVLKLMKEICQEQIKQLAKNSGESPDICIQTVKEIQAAHGENYGYNAKTNKYSNLLEDGVVESVLVPKQVIANAASVANIFITSTYLIINKEEKNESKTKE